MKYLDTYVLAEIASGNNACTHYIGEDFVITDLTLAEFYWVLLRDQGASLADFWFEKLKDYAVPAVKHILIKAMAFRHLHKKKNLSFFDCVGYIFALENHVPFVTGDKEFRTFDGVEHL